MEPVVFTAAGRTSTVLFHDRLSLPRPQGADRPLYVFDSNTVELFGASGTDSAVIPAGETAKSWSSVETILSRALDAGLTRAGVMVGVGGGVIGDLTAFAASVYMRGCGLVLVPTTLLAMVDAAVGGKTGFNFHGYKNMIGTFLPASEVHVAVSCLDSLPEREYSSGLAEVIKTAALGDGELLEQLESGRERILRRDPDMLADAVRRCVVVKVRIVEEDLTETGNRAWLNLGHTFAHALESVSGFGELTHGEAVAWGMARAMDLGLRLGVTREAYARRVVALLQAYGFRTRMPGLDVEALLDAMGRDKKRVSARHRFVLQEDAGVTRVQEVEGLEDVRAVMG